MHDVLHVTGVTTLAMKCVKHAFHIPVFQTPYGLRPTHGSNITPTPIKLKNGSVSKGTPYMWLATNQPIPNIGVKVKMDGA